MNGRQRDYAQQLPGALAHTDRTLRRWLRRYEPPGRKDGAGGEPAPPHCTLTQKLFDQMRSACEQNPK